MSESTEGRRRLETAMKAIRARQYTADLGLALVSIPPGEKGPTQTKGWNQAPNYHVDPDRAAAYWAAHPEEGMGVLHEPSRTAAFDIDDAGSARLALRVVGIDLEAVLALPGPKIIGNPEHPAKPIYHVPANVELSHVKLTWPNPDPDPEAKRVTVLELRAGLVQDVLPPTIHPDTGEPYRWAPSPTDVPIPDVPDVLLDLWRRWNELLPKMQAACPWAGQASSTAKPLTGSSAEWASMRDEVLRRYSLEDALGELGVELRGHKGLCPFHHEDKPSFWTFKGQDGIGRWCCAHGGAPVGVATTSGYSVGDAIDLYAHAHALTPGKAMAELAARHSLTLPGKKIEATGTRETARPYTVRDIAEFMALKVPERKPIFRDTISNDAILRDGDIVMVHAWRGRGKSIVLADAALAITAGARSLRWVAAEPRNALLVDGELPPELIQQRIAKLGMAGGLGLAKERMPVARLAILSAMTEEWGITSMATPEGQARIEPYLDPFDILFFDHLSALFPGAGPENEAASWDATQEWLLKLRRWGKTSIFAHHDSKGGVQRGTSRREDVLDLVLGLREPKDDEQEGTHFELHFEKHRSVYGAAVAPFEAHLKDGPDGRSIWTVIELEDPTLAEIVELTAEGKSARAIGKKLRIATSTVLRRLERAKKRGLL
jgi:hypothetical protein